MTSDDGIKSIADLDEQEVMNLRISALVTARNELMEESVKGCSGNGVESGKIKCTGLRSLRYTI